MVQSLNTKVDLTIKATSYLGLTNVMASVMFKGKWIPRFAVVTKKNGKFIFSSRDNKALLRAVNKYVASENLVRSLSFLDIIKRGIKSLFSKKII